MTALCDVSTCTHSIRRAVSVLGKPVNHTSRQQDGKMVAVAGDDHPILVIDEDSGERISQLRGHGHYSFATAWHPNGRMFATGSQDYTCRVWDGRNMSPLENFFPNAHVKFEHAACFRRKCSCTASAKS